MTVEAKDLPRRLRALAGTLEERAPDAPLLRELEQALARWESALAAKPPESERPPAAGRGKAAAGGPIRIWCDGSCAPNPGPGGWAAIIERDGAREELSGAAPQSTNNIMEMTAAIEALRRTPANARIHVVTDSRYLMDGITRWLPGWKRKGWRKADGQPVLNRALWETLDGLLRSRHVTWAWVAGHSGHPENERCDELANQARLRLESQGSLGI
jgi:ribonuclease HI